MIVPISGCWKTKDILKGKPKGSKLIVLRIFLVVVGVTIHIATGSSAYASTLEMLGAFSSGCGCRHVSN